MSPFPLTTGKAPSFLISQPKSGFLKSSSFATKENFEHFEVTATRGGSAKER